MEITKEMLETKIKNLERAYKFSLLREKAAKDLFNGSVQVNQIVRGANERLVGLLRAGNKPNVQIKPQKEQIKLTNEQIVQNKINIIDKQISQEPIVFVMGRRF